MPELDLDIGSLTARGRKPSAVEARFVRPLVAEDLPALAAARGTEAPPLKRLSERHHALARALALGHSEAEAAAMVGLTSARVSVLKASPAFRELMDLYRQDKDRQFLDTASRLAGLAHDAAVEIAERLEEKPEEVSMGQLLEIAKMGADRTGLGPTSTQKIEDNRIGARIEAARQRALAARQPLIEDAQIVDVTPENPA